MWMGKLDKGKHSLYVEKFPWMQRAKDVWSLNIEANKPSATALKVKIWHSTITCSIIFTHLQPQKFIIRKLFWFGNFSNSFSRFHAKIVSGAHETSGRNFNFTVQIVRTKIHVHMKISANFVLKIETIPYTTQPEGELPTKFTSSTIIFNNKEASFIYYQEMKWVSRRCEWKKAAVENWGA